MKKKMEIFMAVAVLAAACLFARNGAVIVESMNAKQNKICIVIDAGHGETERRPKKFGLARG